MKTWWRVGRIDRFDVERAAGDRVDDEVADAYDETSYTAGYNTDSVCVTSPPVSDGPGVEDVGQLREQAIEGRTPRSPDSGTSSDTWIGPALLSGIGHRSGVDVPAGAARR